MSDEGARRSPRPPVLLGREAGVAEAVERRLPLLGHHRDVPALRHDRLVGEEEVDLRAFALHPDRDLVDRRRRLDALEAEQRPELELGRHAGLGQLDGDVLERHRP